MNRINQINDVFAVSGWNELNQTVNVPRLIEMTEDEVAISCSEHNAFLMEFIEKKPKTNDEKEIMEMYLQISFVIDVLARNGISHGDITADNVIHGLDGRFYLIDFGMSIYLDTRHLGGLDSSSVTSFPKEDRILLGAWYYYSPKIWYDSRYLVFDL